MLLLSAHLSQAKRLLENLLNSQAALAAVTQPKAFKELGWIQDIQSRLYIKTSTFSQCNIYTIFHVLVKHAVVLAYQSSNRPQVRNIELHASKNTHKSTGR